MNVNIHIIIVIIMLRMIHKEYCCGLQTGKHVKFATGEMFICLLALTLLADVIALNFKFHCKDNKVTVLYSYHNAS